MALTLVCNCGDGVITCQLADIKLILFAKYEQFGDVAYGATFWMTINPTGTSEEGVAALFDPSNGVHYVDLPLELANLENWNTVTMYFSTQSSLFQPPTGLPCQWEVSFNVRLHYLCTDLATGRIVKERFKFAGPGAGLGGSDSGCTCFDIIIRTTMSTMGNEWIDEDGDTNRNVGVTSISFTSSPLAAICNGCTSTFAGGLSPKPKASYIMVDGSDAICLCADGGSGSYQYFKRSGVLPIGTELNAETGCIEGTATGPGSGEVEFGVLDVDTGEEAYVTCDLSKSCVGVTTPTFGNRMF